MLFMNDDPVAGYEALGVAVVTQAIRDWKMLCKKGYVGNKNTSVGIETFDSLRFFFNNDCFGYLSTEGIGFNILRKLENYRIQCAGTQHKACKAARTGI